jgi:hypothetical protein
LGEQEIHSRFLLENDKERNHLGDKPKIAGRVLKKLAVKM